MALYFSQLEALKLSGGGLGHFGEELDPPRTLIATDAVADPSLQVAGELLAGSELRLGHDVGGGLGQAGFIITGNHRGFQDRGMGNERTFHLRGAQPESVDLEEVVRSAGVPEVTVLILIILIAGSEPLAHERLFRFFVLIPVAGADGISADPQIANLIRSDGVSVVVDNFRVITGEHFAARASSNLAGAVGNDHVQAFRGAKRIENLDTEALLETLEERCGKRFTRGDRVADTAQVKLFPIFAAVSKQCRVVCGHREEERGAIALDVGVDAGRSRTRLRENGCGATGEREVAGVA